MSFNLDLEHSNVMTALMLILAIIVVAVGGVVVILGNMTYQDYLNVLWKFAGALGLLGIGRGIASNKTPSA